MKTYDIASISYMAMPGLRPEMNRVSFHIYSNLDKVIQIVTDFTGVTVEKMTSNVRAYYVSDSRFIMWYMLKKFTKMTLVDIGVMFNRDHSSVIYGIRRCEDLIKTEKDFQSKVRFLETQLS
jgi:ATPase involved in DNA replication initiation